MAVKLGMYMNAKRAFEDTAPLDANAVTNIEQLVTLRDGDRLQGVDVLIRLSRDQLEHHRQTPDGLDSVSEKHWLGTREFALKEIPGAQLRGTVGRKLTGSVAKMLTAPSLSDFVTKLRTGDRAAKRILLLWGHADAPMGVLFARPPTVTGRAVAVTAAVGGGGRLQRDILSPSDVQRAFADSLPNGAMLDLVCFDACQGASLEFASLLAGHVRYLISSQTPVPGAGWNYASWPALLRGMTTRNRKETAIAVARDFAALGARESSISVIELSGVANVLKALKVVSSSLLASEKLRQELMAIRRKIPTHDADRGGSADLVTLFEKASTAFAKNRQFARQCAAVASAASAAIVESLLAPDLANRIPLRGWSIFMPTEASGFGPPFDAITDSVYFRNLDQLRAFKRTGWHRFVEMSLQPAR
ncbi:MAG: clostripain-related cysteine peptidase [Betaproteobacteria bacterium]